MTPAQWAVALGIASMGFLGSTPGCSPVGALLLGLIVTAVAYGTWDIE